MEWWNLGDSLTDIVNSFCYGAYEITSCSIALLQADIIDLYKKYEQVVDRELPPPIPRGV